MTGIQVKVTSGNENIHNGLGAVLVFVTVLLLVLYFLSKLMIALV